MRSLRRSFIGGLALAFTFLIGMAATPAAAMDVQRVTNGSSGLCLEIYQQSKSNGAVASQWPCSDQLHQTWYFDQQYPDNRWRLINKNSGKCLEVVGWGTNDGAAVGQWDCTGGANQVWYAIDYPGDGTGAMALVNVHSGKCLEIGGWSSTWGARANQWSCHKGANQLWGGVPRW